MASTKAPIKKHDWCQKWCCDVHNVTANRTLHWRTPIEVNTGHTSDISMFRFHFWEPIWYHDPTVKAPHSRLKKGRLLGIAHTSGDAMTYYIETEKESGEGRNVVLIRSTIKTRRKNIGKPADYTNDDPQYANFYLIDPDLYHTDLTITDYPTDVNALGEPNTVTNELTSELPSSIVTRHNNDGDDHTSEHQGLPTVQQTEQLPTDISSDDGERNLNTDDNICAVYDQIAVINTADYEFDRIVDHKFDDGVLKLRVQYFGTDNSHYTDVSFDILKQDVPFDLAKYIREHVMESTRYGRYGQWAKDFLQTHTRALRRLRSSKSATNRKSRNSRKGVNPTNIMFGIRVPRDVREAYALDQINGNKKWGEAIQNEMSALEKMKCFEYKPPSFKPEKGYQYAPMRLIFTIKKEDLRFKARLVIGGHVVDASMHNSYASTVNPLSIRLLLTIAKANNLDIVTADIGNAFVHADSKEMALLE
ncbi:MAG: hypothetical protein ACREOZ_04955 [Gloeomargaritales cyanobacterium]